MGFNYLIHVCSLMWLHIIIYDNDPTMTSLLVCVSSTGDLPTEPVRMMWTFLTSFS